MTVADRENERRELQKIEERMLDVADEGVRKYLRTQRTFCSPGAFWNDAHAFGLCTKEELERARRFHGELWNYAGD